MQSDEKAEKEFNSKELESTTVEGKGLSNLLIGKSHLGDFGRSLCVFCFSRACFSCLVGCLRADLKGLVKVI